MREQHDDEPPVTDRSPMSTVVRLRGIGLWLALACGLIVLVAHSVNALALDDRFFELNARSEGTFFTWLSTSAAFGAALAAAVSALLLPRHRWRLAVVAVAFAYASVDDLLTLHERLGQALFMDGLSLSKELASRLEILVFAPLLGAGLLAAWSMSRELERRIGSTLRTGLIVLVVALALELVAGSTRLLLDGPLAWIDELRIGTEEGMELAGWIVVATGLLAALCAAMVELGRRGPDAAAPDPPPAPEPSPAPQPEPSLSGGS